MAENGIDGPVLGVAWDGTGLGTDGTIWGGEFLAVDEEGFRRVAHLRTFKLPGGAVVAREPRRSALGLLYEIFGEELFELPLTETIRAFSRQDLSILRKMLSGAKSAPNTSSAGRLFDAIASMIGLRQRVSFEGQAAMELEYAADREIERSYRFEIRGENPLLVDWEPAVRDLLNDTLAGISMPGIARAFHNTLAEMIVQVAQVIGEKRVVLSGGCFQNKVLLEGAVARLRREGFAVFWHRQVPTNDGGISLGQTVAALRAAKAELAL
jgi:hydrogenase maturation protein HypF